MLQRFGTDTVGLTRHVGALGRTHGGNEATQRGLEQLTTDNVEELTTDNVEELTTDNVEELTTDNVEADESYFVLNLAADW